MNETRQYSDSDARAASNVINQVLAKGDCEESSCKITATLGDWEVEVLTRRGWKPFTTLKRAGKVIYQGTHLAIKKSRRRRN